VPAALASAHGALSRRGVLVLGADALDSLADVDTALLDKTGTLSLGQPRLLATTALDGGEAEPWRRIAAALEHGARHPFAAAFDVTGVVPAESVRTVPGQGIEGKVDGIAWRLGQAGFAAGRDDDGALWLGDGQRAAARFLLADPLRPEAAAVIATLKSLGITPRIASGDGAAGVADIASALEIDDARARQSPEDKLAAVRALQAAGHRVLAVGDGINDGPLLAGADVSIAMAAGAPLAQRAADLVLTGASLARIPEAIVLARRTRAIIRQNLAWALAYNLLALPFAAMGWVTPGLAALGMAASSLLVTANALRLGREPETAE
jgi:Cu2+-exporting ATPase